jgi:hypothetical protein
MEEPAENLSSIKHFSPAAGTGLRGKLLWQYFGGVKDLGGQKAPHGLGVKRFACERAQSHLSRVETGRWVLGELEGYGLSHCVKPQMKILSGFAKLLALCFGTTANQTRPNPVNLNGGDI